MLKMVNKIQHYNWGSKTALTDIYGIENPDNQPMAELWMGAHPKCSSLVTDPQTGETIALNTLIDKEPEKYLGEKASTIPTFAFFVQSIMCSSASVYSSAS